MEDRERRTGAVALAANFKAVRVEMAKVAAVGLQRRPRGVADGVEDRYVEAHEARVC